MTWIHYAPVVTQPVRQLLLRTCCQANTSRQVASAASIEVAPLPSSCTRDNVSLFRSRRSRSARQLICQPTDSEMRSSRGLLGREPRMVAKKTVTMLSCRWQRRCHPTKAPWPSAHFKTARTRPLRFASQVLSGLNTLSLLQASRLSPFRLRYGYRLYRPSGVHGNGPCRIQPVPRVRRAWCTGANGHGARGAAA